MVPPSILTVMLLLCAVVEAVTEVLGAVGSLSTKPTTLAFETMTASI